MKTTSVDRMLVQGALTLLLVSGMSGCATARHDPAPAGYKGPVEDPQKKTTWWSVLGFIVTPIGKLLSTSEKN